jgi:hypothetical protein
MDMHLEYSIEHVPNARYARPVSNPISLGMVPVKALNAIVTAKEESVRPFARMRQKRRILSFSIEHLRKYRDVRLVSSPISLGIDPVRAFLP